MAESEILGPDGNPFEYKPREEYLLEFFAYETIGMTDLQSVTELAARLAGKEDADVYREGNGVEFRHSGTEGVTTVEVLEFLKGLPFDNLVVAWLHSLRPSTVRVSHGQVCLDNRTWRVTVFLNEDDTVRKIVQEVAVGYGCGANVGEITDARREGREPRPMAGAIGHTAGLARVDFE